MEEIQKQLQDLLKNKNLQVAFAPFMQSMNKDSEEDKSKETENPPPSKNKDPEPASDPLESIRSFDRKPKEIRDYLDRFVIKQEQAKRVLSVAVCDHYNHVRRCLKDTRAQSAEYMKPNVLLLGPTGVGKTYLMRNVAKLIGVPFVKADATKFSETGYVGNDVEDLCATSSNRRKVMWSSPSMVLFMSTRSTKSPPRAPVAGEMFPAGAYKSTCSN